MGALSFSGAGLENDVGGEPSQENDNINQGDKRQNRSGGATNGSGRNAGIRAALNRGVEGKAHHRDKEHNEKLANGQIAAFRVTETGKRLHGH